MRAPTLAGCQEPYRRSNCCSMHFPPQHVARSRTDVVIVAVCISHPSTGATLVVPTLCKIKENTLVRYDLNSCKIILFLGRLGLRFTYTPIRGWHFCISTDCHAASGEKETPDRRCIAPFDTSLDSQVASGGRGAAGACCMIPPTHTLAVRHHSHYTFNGLGCGVLAAAAACEGEATACRFSERGRLRSDCDCHRKNRVRAEPLWSRVPRSRPSIRQTVVPE